MNHIIMYHDKKMNESRYEFISHVHTPSCQVNGPGVWTMSTSGKLSGSFAYSEEMGNKYSLYTDIGRGVLALPFMSMPS